MKIKLKTALFYSGLALATVYVLFPVLIVFSIYDTVTSRDLR